MTFQVLERNTAVVTSALLTVSALNVLNLCLDVLAMEDISITESHLEEIKSELIQGCCPTGAQQPGAPKKVLWAPKFLQQLPEHNLLGC